MSPLHPVQQRERIALAQKPKSCYLSLERASGLDRAYLVLASVYLWQDDNASPLELDCYETRWPLGEARLELHVKTPSALSNRTDKEGRDSGFFYHFELLERNLETHGFDRVDQLTSNVFRTVSHSKMTDNRRRVSVGRKPSVCRIETGPLRRSTRIQSKRPAEDPTFIPKRQRLLPKLPKPAPVLAVEQLDDPLFSLSAGSLSNDDHLLSEVKNLLRQQQLELN